MLEQMELLISEKLPVIIQVIGSWIIILLIASFLNRVLKKVLSSESVNLIFSTQVLEISSRVVSWLLWILTVLLMMQQAGMNLGSIWTVLSTVATLIAVGFIAVWSVLSNVMCSLILIIFRPFSIGQHIEILEPAGETGLRGKVIDFNLIFTTLEQEEPDGDGVCQVQIPNNIFFQKNTRVYSKPQKTKRLDQQLFDNQTESPIASKETESA